MNSEHPSQFRVLIDSNVRSARELDLEDRESSMPRLWRGFMAARILVAGVLLLMLLYLRVMGQAPQTLAFLLCIVYLAVTVWVRVLGRPMLPDARFDPQWLATIGVDVAVFAALLYLKVGTISYVPLFLLPVLLASVLGPLLLALGTAAAVTLVLLLDALQYSLTQIPESVGYYVQAAITSTGLFALAYLTNQMAVRLVAQERMALGSEMAARAQIKVNELVIDALTDGVLVMDANGIVHAANPAARALLSFEVEQGDQALKPPFVLAARAAWQGLADVAMEAFAGRKDLQRDVVLDNGKGSQYLVHVKTYFSVVAGAPARGSLCVMFLQDLREMEARVRTEKLAAMGRMSAAVAHEIRNPLSAIAQANALLAEELKAPQQQQLAHLVAQNVQRLNRVVEDVLDVARAQGGGSDDRAVLHDCTAYIQDVAMDWSLQHSAKNILSLQLESSWVALEFDRDHLRRVLVNLLDNALRHSSKLPGSIQLAFSAGSPGSSWQLRVWSDGAPIEEGVRRHLFEPFFSSQSRSSGLGLFICRELCMRHGASIAYQRTIRTMRQSETNVERMGNEFVLHLRQSMEVTQPITALADRFGGTGR
jgi:two-component system, NtrC family, sensor histidine kinase PilS